ncbi:unnamed protein product [Durusdinium trenchii]|uniref:Uncharacterized protein n=1 Tax=Durusdinium trenchii TaxID=1381693 RepID=A0ABP0H871_9DINO
MAGDKTYFQNGNLTAAFQNQGMAPGSLVGASSPCVRVFVAGAVTHVGKTSVCLGLLAALRNSGLKASELGYIKPATQCEAPDLLSKWCASEGIEHVAGENAPLVFYSGFTRSFLAGEQGTSAEWLQKIQQKVAAMSEGRRVLIIDGVGFPSVGSIVGVDNADVAKAAKAPVLLVCKSGVGSAVDSFSLNASYFVAKGVPVLGALFNLGDADGFYSWDKCAKSIEAWFSQQDRRERFYGVVPKVQELDGLREKISETEEDALDVMAKLNADHFGKHADILGIFTDAGADPWCRSPVRVPDGKASSLAPATSASFKPLSRESVVSSAKEAGAKGGG